MVGGYEKRQFVLYGSTIGYHLNDKGPNTVINPTLDMGIGISYIQDNVNNFSCTR